MGRVIGEIEKDIRQEEAASESQGTRTQPETLNMNKLYPRSPPRNWYELKEMLANFFVLLWVFLGYFSPLYDQVFNIL